MLTLLTNPVLAQLTPATPPAEKTDDTQPIKKKRKRKEMTHGFGIVAKHNPQAQVLRVNVFNWDKNADEEIIFYYKPNDLELFNVEQITDIKKGDEVEYDWEFGGPENKQQRIKRLAKGSMPMEPIVIEPLVILPALGAGAEAQVDETIQAVDVTEGVDTQISETVPANQDIAGTVVDETQATGTTP